MILNKQVTAAALAAGVSIALLTSCSSSNKSNTAPEAGTVSVPTIDEALADFPNSLLPRFAISNSEVTAVEVFRRIDYVAGTATATSYGVEGATEDELLELEARYADDGSLIESVRNEILDTLPEPIDTALKARYPDAVISEIARSTAGTDIAYAILIETMGEEIEVNYDDSANLLFVENVEPRDMIPATIVAIVDALAVTMPDSEWEIVTFADDSLEYAIEYENEDDQSITIVLNASGDIVRVEHEDALANLSSSETVQDALVNFPVGIEADFAAMFSEVTAAEIFRSQEISATGEITNSFGIEGVSADETLEIEAIYSDQVVLLEQGRGEIIDVLPANIDAAFNARYPGAVIEEMAESTDDDGTSYSVLFVLNDDEQEANFDANGEFDSLESLLEEEDIPAELLNAIGAERVLLPIVEFELVTAADDSVTYTVEYENDDGDSISYKLDAQANILQIDHEAALVN